MFIGEAAVWSVYLFQMWQTKRIALQDHVDEVVPSAINQLDAGVVVDDVDRMLKDSEHDKQLTGWRNFLFWIPTICDLTATTVSILNEVSLR
jgi:hypothetical protein